MKLTKSSTLGGAYIYSKRSYTFLYCLKIIHKTGLRAKALVELSAIYRVSTNKLN